MSSSNPTQLGVVAGGVAGSGGSLALLSQRLNLKQLLAIVINSSVIFKSFSVAVLVGYVVAHHSTLNDYLSVVPGKLLPPNLFVWTLVTHSFVELRLIELLADWFVLLLFTKMLEPMWGRLECLRFYFIMTSSVALTTALVYFALFALTFDELLLFNRYVHGLGGLLGAFSVAMKQLMPDSILLDFSFLRLKQDNLPLLLILISFVVYLVSLTDLTYVLMIIFGVLYGWTYLRFFQKHNNGTRGDSSSSFVFASLFPGQIQPFVAILANTIFNILVRLKICKALPKRYNVSSFGSGASASNQSHITITIPLITQTPGADNSDAERRRTKALKALKERLKKPGEDEEQLKSAVADWASDPTPSPPASSSVPGAQTGVSSPSSSSVVIEADPPA